MLKANHFSKLDPLLQAYNDEIAKQQMSVKLNQDRLLAGQSVEDFALGHDYFGLHKTPNGWVLREWAPGATRMFLINSLTNWQESDATRFKRIDHGQWELRVNKRSLEHLQHYKLRVHWPGGSGDRLPSYTTYAVQDSASATFDAVVWSPPKPYIWHDYNFKPPDGPPLIYEAHVGMSSQEPSVASYKHFTHYILPRIKTAGYNTVQLMAIQEHPYYGSFGYQVSNFFAASSRFGTPDDLKELVDTAHALGLRVIMDLVHSHAASNEVEGLSRFDGRLDQYFHGGSRERHPSWDSRLFNYGKPEVFHFLLSNCRFWLDEYHFDGFRFDGVTSMLYRDHGIGKVFSYGDYYTPQVDVDALTYLSCANQLIHSVKPDSLVIAEDVSGFPGLAAPQDKGGYGFDYRLSMGVPDLWIKILKEQRDEDWNLGQLLHELTTKRPEERVISYSESHDQALVGDQTLIFRLIDKNMYHHMAIDDKDPRTERGMALIKMIRLITAACHGGGYLNFMGNEFGHPEWIDFPRAGNDWSYAYARRQWKLADDSTLKYSQLSAFDKSMLKIISRLEKPLDHVHINQSDQILSFTRGEYLFAFNFSPTRSVVDYSLPADPGSYRVALSTDELSYGGHHRVEENVQHLSQSTAKTDQITVYIPARCAVVLVKNKS